jgi:RNA polymerase sigma-70 factor (ECF subfamily)
MYLAIENHSIEEYSDERATHLPYAPPTVTELALEELSSVFAFIYRRVGNRQDAEDLTQEVAVRALPRLREGHAAPAVRTYLFTTARSILADFWRMRLGRPVDELLEDAHLEVDVAETPETARAEVERILRLLPAHYRRLLELRFLRGYSSKEVAAEMGMTLGAVKVMQLRALRAASARGSSPQGWASRGGDGSTFRLGASGGMPCRTASPGERRAIRPWPAADPGKRRPDANGGPS